MRHALLVLVLVHAGCEGCDFSFGPIPITVTVHAGDRGHRVHLRRGAALRLGDTGYGNADPHSVVLSVGWHGYTVCKVPAMEILVEAEGCEPTAIMTERAVG